MIRNRYMFVTRRK